jgi:hypothetical protein
VSVGISPEEYLEIGRASDVKYEYDNGHIYRQYGPREKVELISIRLVFPIKALYRLTDVPEQEVNSSFS